MPEWSRSRRGCRRLPNRASSYCAESGVQGFGSAFRPDLLEAGRCQTVGLRGYACMHGCM